MDYKQFESQVPYPSREDYVRHFLYYKGECLTPKDGVSKEERDELLKKYPKAVKEFLTDEVAYDKAREAYGDSVCDGERRFQEYLEDKYCTKDKPKKGALYEKAWEMGHAYGFSEVENYYADLVDLIL